MPKRISRDIHEHVVRTVTSGDGAPGTIVWSSGGKSATYKRKGSKKCPSVYELSASKGTKSAPRYIIS